MKQIIICPNCATQHTPSIALLDCTCGFALSSVEITYIEDAPLSSDVAESAIHMSATVNQVSDQTTCQDCGASFSRQDYQYCPYCPPPATAEATKQTVSLVWPWGKETLIERLTVGREPPATVQLAARLESQYPNISRRHAELIWQNNMLFIQDLGSSNGTFVNGQRIAVRQSITLKHGDKIRFASNLELSIDIE